MDEVAIIIISLSFISIVYIFEEFWSAYFIVLKTQVKSGIYFHVKATVTH